MTKKSGRQRRCASREGSGQLEVRTSSAAFREGAVEVHQILVSRGQQRGLPLTREGLYSSANL
ncbi:MAG: hypothetical protein AABN95_03620 [Acidobacteriota bacterium]